MLDLGTQVREYLDATAPAVKLEEILVKPVTDPPVRPLIERRPKRRIPGWAYAAAVAAGVLFVVAAFAFLLRSMGDVAPVDHPTTTVVPSSLEWSRVAHSEQILGGSGDQRLLSVTSGGPGLVAVGYDQSGGFSDAAVWVSSDGLTWDRVPHDESVFGGAGVQEMWSVTSGGPGLVAVGLDRAVRGADAAVWVSSDGLAWDRLPHDQSAFGGADVQEMWSVTSGGPGLVAVGSDRTESGADAAVWVSSDGLTWDRLPHDESVFGGEGFHEMFSVTRGDRGFVAVGHHQTGSDHDAAVWTSGDGMTWSRVVHNESVFGGPSNQDMANVTRGGPGFVAVGSDWSANDFNAAVWISSEGFAWSRIQHNDALFGDAEMRSVSARGRRLVAAGHDGSGGSLEAAVWTSVDGISWSRVRDDDAVFGGSGVQEIWSATATGPGWVAVGSDSSGEDADGAVWTAVGEN